MDTDRGRDARPAEQSPLQDDRRCFACGPENDQGLQLHFEYGDGTARSHFLIEPRFAGWTSIVHGGVVATVLDEAMAHAAIAAGVRAVTARLEIRFRKAAPINETLLVEGRVEGRRGRLLSLVAKVSGTDDTVYAEAQGRFVADVASGA
ncbi:MAG: PaaI family thioesterase [Candidatus Eremiobacteraeota bacterium]|nr:PaaI family thioesterase [Candidatus Eremiobacteraeota bacterium]